MVSFERQCKWVSIFTVIILIFVNSFPSQARPQEPDIAWIQNYSAIRSDGQDTPKDMIIDPAGNIYVLAEVENLAHGTSMLLVKYDSGGQQLWRAEYYDGLGKLNRAIELGVDSDQNIYVLGQVNELGLYSKIVIIKYDATGNQLWVAKYEGEFNATASALAVSPTGEVYVLGGSATFESDSDIVLIKYDSNGNQQWSDTYNSEFGLDDKAVESALASNGNICTVGTSCTSDENVRQVVTACFTPDGNRTWVTTHDVGTGDSGATTLLTGVNSNVFVLARNGRHSEIVKYGSSGQQLWIAQTEEISSQEHSYANAMTVGHDENIYLAGLNRQSKNNFFTAKYDSNGSEQWSKIYDGGSTDVANAVAVDTAGNVYSAGSSFSQATLNDFALVKYDQSGAMQWVQLYDAIQNENATSVIAELGSVLVMGSAESNLLHSRDISLLKYNSDGTRDWDIRLACPGQTEAIRADLGIDDADNIYLAGTNHKDPHRSNYIAIKYSPQGELLWETEYSGRPEQPLNSLREAVVDLEGNTYLGGLRFSFQKSDLNVVKIDHSGQQQWDHIINTDDPRSSETIYAMAVRNETLCLSTSDESKGLICLDASSGLTNWIFPQDRFEVIYRILFDDQSNVYTIGREINERFVFIRRYDSIGNLNWSTQLEEAFIANGVAPFAIQKEGYVYLTITAGAHSVTAKYTLEGEQVWLNKYTDAFANPVAIAVDDSANVYVAGLIRTPETGDDYLLLKYDKNGTIQWVRTYNGWQDGDDEVVTMAVDGNDNGNIILTGRSERPSGPFALRTVDYGTVSYSSNGDILWTANYNSPGNREDFVTSLVLDSQNDVIVSGVSSFTVFSSSSISFQSVATTTIKYINSVPTFVSDAGTAGPRHPYLEQNYPNPFNPTTRITFYLPERDEVRLTIYNLFGQKVTTLLNGVSLAGRQSVEWDGHDKNGKPVASGLYFYRLESSRFVESQRMLLLR